MNANRLSARVAIVCLATASAGLSLAIISITKILLVIATLIALLRVKTATTGVAAWQSMLTPRLVLTVVFVFATSLLWTTSQMSNAFGMMGKYGKLLVIPALLVLIRTRREATWALGAFLGAQVFLLVSSWLLYFRIPVVWATSNVATSTYAVFSSYLDQGIMSAVVAAVFWHLKTLAPSKFWFGSAVGLSILALTSVFVVFVGRTGYVVGIVMISMASFWILPTRYQLASLLLPPLLFLVAVFSLDSVSSRVKFTQAELNAYSTKPDTAKEANRIDFWRTSIEAISQKPLLGSGVGSWVTEYDKIERLRNPAYIDLGLKTSGNHGNPHQEFLLWGVQLGVGGILLLLAFFVAAYIDFSKMEPCVARAGKSVLGALFFSFLFNSTLSDAYIGDFFCLLLGVLLAFGARFDSALALTTVKP
jgi:O-antigen ligase